MPRYALFWLALSLAAQPHNVLTDAEKAEGWELLFDGQSTAQWTSGIGLDFPKNTWGIEDQCLTLRQPSPNAGSLFSKNAYRDFDVKFSWKIGPRGNSGFKYNGVAGRRHPDYFYARNWAARNLAIGALSLLLFSILLVRRVSFFARPVPRRIGLVLLTLGVLMLAFTTGGLIALHQMTGQRPAGFEYQIIDDAAHPDARQKPSRLTGGLYDVLAPTGAEPLPPGQFNESRVVQRGNHVEHWLNGKKILEFEYGSEVLRQAVRNSKFIVTEGFGEKGDGYFELQAHGDKVWFRDLKVRRLQP
jgi:hypothetical protein